VTNDLLAFLKDEEARSYDGSLLEEVEVAINSYNGAPYGDEEDGRSQVTARDVAEVVDHMTVSMLRTFVSGDRVVELEPSGPDQEQIADDATEALTADMRRNGYRLIHDWIKAGNLEKIGIVKTCVERRKQRVVEEVPAELLPDDLAAAGIIEAEPVDEFETMFRIAALQDAPPSFKDFNVPLEEFRFSPDARDLDTAVYLAHVVEKSISDLVEMGFDRDLVETIQGDTNPHSALTHARSEFRIDSVGERQGALRKVWLLEEYAFFDANGDGIAERLCVHRVGNTILSVEECDYQPFEYWTPFPMPARLVGQSLADKVIDIQRVNTVLERNALDSLYLQVAPGHYVHEDSVGDHTIDDLLTVRPSRIVRHRGQTPPIPEVRNDVSQIAFNAIEFKIGQRESRTGITRMNQGLDADSLNKTATGTALMQAQGQQIEEYLARNFAEALARFFRKKLKLRQRYGEPFQMRVDGEFRQIDPSQWPEDMDAQIRVGLGSGRKEQRLMYRQMLLGIQAQAMSTGLSLVKEQHLYNNVAGMVKDAQLGSPADYMAAPPTDEMGNPVEQPKPPSPEEQKMQAEMQMKAVDLQAKQQEAALKLELERVKAEEAAQLAREKAEFEREQAIAQMMFEREMAREEFEHERQLAFYKADKDAEAKKYRDGGSLAA
jgi:hypothetical protein